MTEINNYVFFYGGYCSNFAETHFVWTAFGQTHEFFCSEQAFMWVKAMHFEDYEIAKKIIDEKYDPMVCKKLGREVKNYDDSKWADVRFEYMKAVVFEKFNQNEPLAKALCDKRYDGKIFVEASPTDRIWGIGFSVKTPEDILGDEKNWRGTNLLGKCINSVREKLLIGLGREA